MRASRLGKSPSRTALRCGYGAVWCKGAPPLSSKQLEEGRFVAAAWESGGHIHLILCHPNRAKGLLTLSS